MKDLDFDELDRAVNSLMSKADDDKKPTASEVAETTIATPAATTPSEAADAAPSLTKADEAAPETAETASTASPSLATKRSGRFMDVVPASASSQLTTLPPRKPSRVAPALKPINDIVAPPKPSPAPVPAAAVEAETPVAPVSTMEATVPADTLAASSWPDPIDMHEQQEAVQPTDEAQSQPSTAAAKTETSMPDPLETETASSTPFLPDAKVEKRPLGTPAPLDASAASLDQPAVVAKEEDTDAQVTPQPMPAELSEDVLAIESDSRLIEEPEEPENKEKTPTSTTATEAAPKPEAASTSDAKEAAPSEEPAQSTPPLGSSSISQQYKVAGSTRDQSHAALYDNAAEPLKHPAKQKSSWPIIVIILLLVLIGAGGGAALYFLKLI